MIETGAMDHLSRITELYVPLGDALITRPDEGVCLAGTYPTTGCPYYRRVHSRQ